MRYDLLRRYRWHNWFAWWPVVIGDTIVWLETVERQLVRVNPTTVFQYRLIDK